MEAKDYYIYLFNKYLKNEASAAEKEELMEVLLPEEYSGEWEEQIKNVLMHSDADPDYDEAGWNAIIRQILKRRRKAGLITGQWGRWAAAAVLLLLSMTVIYIWKAGDLFTGVKQAQEQVAAPGKRGAVLTLSNGQQVVLDSLGNGLITREGKTALIIRNGMLVYDAAQTKDTVVYNTVTTPAGKEFLVVLPDGSTAHLNAGSSIRYPTVFNDTDRRVVISGEIYFEVKKNPAQPFIASVNALSVKVLGTKFDIKAYTDESLFKTTLAEGKVAVTVNDQHTVLAPGYQAQWQPGTVLHTVPVDLEEELGWVNGYFVFRHASIETIMRQAARWYNLEIVYKNKPAQLFIADIPRSVDITEFLSILEATGWVHFQIEGNKVIVE